MPLLGKVEVPLSGVSIAMSDDVGELVFCRSFRHHVTGKIIYPKNGRFFVFRAKSRGNEAKGPLPIQLELPLVDEAKT